MKYVCLHLKAQRLEMDDEERERKIVMLMVKMVVALSRQKHKSSFNISSINHKQNFSNLVSL